MAKQAIVIIDERTVMPVGFPMSEFLTFSVKPSSWTYPPGGSTVRTFGSTKCTTSPCTCMIRPMWTRVRALADRKLADLCGSDRSSAQRGNLLTFVDQSSAGRGNLLTFVDRSSAQRSAENC